MHTRLNTMGSKILKRSSRRLSTLYKSLPTTKKATALGVDADIPVFMLPHKDLEAIPEDRVINGGFDVRTLEIPQQRRRFSGLVSFSDIDNEQMLFERSAMTAVEFRSFSCASRAE